MHANYCRWFTMKNVFSSEMEREKLLTDDPIYEVTPEEILQSENSIRNRGNNDVERFED